MPLLTLKMLMIQYSSGPCARVPLNLGFSTETTSGRSHRPPPANGSKNATYSLSMTHYQSLSRCMQMQIRTCNCPYCAPFFQVDSLCTPLEPLQRAKYLDSYITPTSSSVPDVNFRCSQASLCLQNLGSFFQTSTYFPKKINYRSTHKSFRLSSMVQNPKYTPQHKSPKLTVYITKLSDKYLRSRVHSTIGSFFLLIPLARMNSCFPFPTPSFLLVFLHPFESQIPG